MKLVLFYAVEDIPGEVDVGLFQHVECALSPVNTDVTQLIILWSVLCPFFSA